MKSIILLFSWAIILASTSQYAASSPVAQQAYIKAGIPWKGDNFGGSVAISGTTLVVGAPNRDSDQNRNDGYEVGTNYGAAYVFEWNGTSWIQVQILEPPSPGTLGNRGSFGSSVAIDGDTIVVGAPNERNAVYLRGIAGPVFSHYEYGAAYVYQLENSGWIEVAQLRSSNPRLQMSFGSSVAIYGETAVVGAPGESETGAAFVFKRSLYKNLHYRWDQQALLKSNAPSFSSIFGSSLSISGNTIVIGASGESDNVGAAYVFSYNGTAWNLDGKLQPPTSIVGAAFGNSVGISGNTVIVGAPGWLSGSRVGAAFVFGRSGASWNRQHQLAPSNPGVDDRFGNSVSISGNTIVVGAPWEDSSSTGVNGTPNDSAQNAGAAYVYVNTGSTWRQQSYLKASNSGAGDTFGLAVAVSSNVVAVGAPNEDGSNGGVNSASNEVHANSGASYVFKGFGLQAFKPAIAVEESGIEIPNGGTSDFGQLQAGGSATKTFTILNRGTDPLKLFGSPAVVVSGKDAGYFKVTSYPATTLAAGSSTLFNVKFTAVGTGDKSATLTIPNNDVSGNPFVIRLAGSVPPPSTPRQIAQVAYLKASNTDPQDWFGYSVAVSGDTVVVGAPGEASGSKGVDGAQFNNSQEGSGAAYVFVKTGNTWVQQAYLKASNSSAWHEFGTCVAISGDTIAVSAPFQGKPASATVNSTHNYGAVFIFVRNGGSWTQQARLLASNTRDQVGHGDKFGAAWSSVALSGNTLVVGAKWEESSARGVNGDEMNDDSPRSGAAYVFVRSGSVWSQEAYLKASNTDEYDNFGYSVSISGNTIVVGAPFESSSAAGVGGNQADNSLFESGAAYVFTRNGSSWTQQAYLKASNPDAQDNFGACVSVSADTIVIGAPLEQGANRGVNSVPNDSAVFVGAAYIFCRENGKWSQQAYLKASNADAGDGFGSFVAASPNLVLVGAEGEDSGFELGKIDPSMNNAENSGSAYAFQRSGNTWVERSFLKARNCGAKDYFGRALAISGTTLVVGAFFEDSQTRGVNTKAGEGAPDSGAAYIFDSSGPRKPDIEVQQPKGISLRNGKGRTNFGRMKIKGGGKSKVFMIKNQGNEDLDKLAVRIKGLNSRDFKIKQPLKRILRPGKSTWLTVIFRPRAYGTRRATLEILSNDKDESPFYIRLVGDGVR